MDYNYINQLLLKYWEGETSLEDEKALKSYFNSEHVDERLAKHKSLFQFIKKEQCKTLNTDLNEKIINQIYPRKIVSMNWKKGLVAASIILISGFFIWNYSLNDNTNKYTAVKEIENPEEAFRIAKEALLLVSNKLNDGASRAASKVNKVKEINRYVKTGK